MPHQTNCPTTNVEWLTPPGIIAALGDFDLYPCTPESMPWATARHRYTAVDDGLLKPWLGRVWLNPPFGPYAAKWLVRMRDHANGIALIPARTETRMFFTSVWGYADGVSLSRDVCGFTTPMALFPSAASTLLSASSPTARTTVSPWNNAALEWWFRLAG